MKKVVQVQEVDGEGLVGLLGQRVTLYCLNYIYTGTLTGVNETDARLDDAAIVYETGPHTTSTWQDVQLIPGGVWYVRLSAIESYGIFK